MNQLFFPLPKLFAVLAFAIFALPLSGVVLNEIRTDQPDNPDDEEFVELRGEPGESLDGVWFLSIGDHSGEGRFKGSGVVEIALDLTGYSIPDDGHFLMVGPLFDGDAFGLTANDVDYLFEGFGNALENSDNVTAVLVRNFTGNGGNEIRGIDDQLGDTAVDIDDDNDGVPNATLPWDETLDAIGLVESPPPFESSQIDEYNYGVALGFADVGPVDGFVPSHAFRASDIEEWFPGEYVLFEEDMNGQIIGLNPEGSDSPGMINPIAPPPVYVPIVESLSGIFGLSGDVIAVAGLNLELTTSVTIGGIDADFVINGLSLEVTIPLLAETGRLQVVNPDGSDTTINSIVIVDISDAILVEDFGGGFSGFSAFSVASTANWEAGEIEDSSFIGIQGYGADEASDDWLISPGIDLSGISGANLMFGHERGFGGPDLELKISSDYTDSGDPAAATWALLDATFAGDSTNVVTDSGQVDLSAYQGETVHIAFRYMSDGTGPGDGAIDRIHYFVVLDNLSSFGVSIVETELGTIDLNPNLESYPAGTEVTISAIPDEGYEFVEWVGDLVAASNPAVISINGDLTVEAAFGPELYDVIVSESGFGTTTSSGELNDLPPGTEVTLGFAPNRGYEFSGWSGSIYSNENPVIITVLGDHSITPTVVELPRQTVNIGESTGYSVNVDPENDYYFKGESITVGILIDTGYDFISWDAPFSLKGESFGYTFPEVDTSTEVNLSAQVDLLEFDLIVGGSDFGESSASRELVGIPFGTQISVEFLPLRGYAFSGWTGSIESQDNPLIFTVQENQSISPNTTELPRSIAIVSEGEGYLVTLSPEQEFYLPGESVTATVEVEEGYEFVGWNNPEEGDDENLMYTFPEISESQDVLFTPQVERLLFDVKVVDPENGSTSASTELKDIPYGTELTLQFTPVRGYAFMDWAGSVESEENPLVLTIEDDLIVVPRITELPKHTLSVTSGEGFSTQIESLEEFYFQGESISVVLIIEEGYEFSGWGEPFSGEEMSLSYTFPDSEEPLEIPISPIVVPLLFDIAIVDSDYGTTTASKELIDIPYGTALILEFVPNRGYAFKQWGGSIDSEDNPLSLVVKEDLSIFPKTAELPRHIVSLINGAGYSLAIQPLLDFYMPGESASVALGLNEGFELNGWNLPKGGQGDPLSFTFPEIDATTVTLFWPNVEAIPSTSIWDDFENYDDWLFGWLGWIQKLSPEYIYHMNLGTMYYTGEADDSLWFYLFSPELEWIWAGKFFYPYMYSPGRGWLLHLEGTDWFNDLQTTEWFQVTP